MVHFGAFLFWDVGFVGASRGFGVASGLGRIRD